MNACDHSKQGLETQIASETHNDPEWEVKDGYDFSKNVPDDIDKDVTDVIGSMGYGWKWAFPKWIFTW